MRLEVLVLVVCIGLAAFSCATAGSYSKAVGYDRTGQHENAVTEFTKAIAWDPDHPAPRNGRGIAYVNLGQYENALRDFNEAIRLDPNCYPASYNRGNLYAATLEDYERAIEDLGKCLELNGDFAPAYQSRGAAYLRMGDDERACKDWRRACELGLSQGCASVKGVC